MGHCASAPRDPGPSDSLARAGPRGAARPQAGQPAQGVLVLVQLAHDVQHATCSEPQQLYMCRTNEWHSFHAAGFLVKAAQGAEGACVHDAVLAAPPAVLAVLETQSCTLGQRQSNTLRVRWEALLSLPCVKAVALAAPTTPLATTEAARLKAFAASLAADDAAQPKQEDLSQRARLLSGRGRKAFLPLLIGEALVAMGRLQRAADDVFESARHQGWIMPDLDFVMRTSPARTAQDQIMASSLALPTSSSSIVWAVGNAAPKQSQRGQQTSQQHVKDRPSSHSSLSPHTLGHHSGLHAGAPSAPQSLAAVVRCAAPPSGPTHTTGALPHHSLDGHLTSLTPGSSASHVPDVLARLSATTSRAAAEASPASGLAISLQSLLAPPSRAADVAPVEDAGRTKTAGPTAEATSTWCFLSRLMASQSLQVLGLAPQEQQPPARSAAHAGAGILRHRHQVLQAV